MSLGSFWFNMRKIRTIFFCLPELFISKSGFLNRTRNPKTDFTSEKSVLRVDFN